MRYLKAKERFRSSDDTMANAERYFDQSDSAAHRYFPSERFPRSFARALVEDLAKSSAQNWTSASAQCVLTAAAEHSSFVSSCIAAVLFGRAPDTRGKLSESLINNFRTTGIFDLTAPDVPAGYRMAGRFQLRKHRSRETHSKANSMQLTPAVRARIRNSTVTRAGGDGRDCVSERGP